MPSEGRVVVGFCLFPSPSSAITPSGGHSQVIDKCSLITLLLLGDRCREEKRKKETTALCRFKISSDVLKSLAYMVLLRDKGTSLASIAPCHH